MKKLLLATSLVAMSSTAIAANTSTKLDSVVTDVLTVSAKFVKPIELALDVTTIDFGDVWSDSTVAVQPVIATVTGEANETFTYSITTDGSFVAITGAGSAGDSTVSFTTGGTSETINFNVGLVVDPATTNTVVSEIVTFTVQYDAIAKTPGVDTPASA